MRMRVSWFYRGNYYAMKEVPPVEIAALRRRISSDILGVPTIWCRYMNGDFDWFPDCMEGEPVVEILPTARRP